MTQEAVVKIRIDGSSAGPEAQKVAASLGVIGRTGEISARQTAAAMRLLPAQLSDVAVSLAGGQNPLLVLLQQGTQVRDSFGGIRPALSGIRAALSPLALGVGAVAAVLGTYATVVLAADRRTRELNNTIALTGGASALTEDRVRSMASGISDAYKVTEGAARDTINAVARVGTVAAENIESTAAAASRLAQLTGGSASEIGARLAGQQGDAARYAAELNRQYNFLTLEIYRQVRALEDQGRTAEAVELVNRRLTESTREQQVEVSWLGRAVAFASSQWREFKDAIFGLAEDETPLEAVRKMRQELALLVEVQSRREDGQVFGLLGGTDDKEREERIAKLRENIRLSQRAVDNANADVDRKARSAREEANKIEAERLAEQERDKNGRLLAAQRRYLGDLDISTRRAAINLIQDEEAKGQSLIELDRQTALRRLQAQTLGAQQRVQAAAQIEAQAAIARAALGKRLDSEAGKDPLGTFIQERVLPADEERGRRRLVAQEDFLSDLRLANERANIALLENDEERAQAQIELERRTSLAVLAAREGLSDGARGEATALINSTADRNREVSTRQFARQLGEEARQSLRSSLQAAFRDTSNPAKAFATALAAEVYTRLTARLADALADGLVGANGSGGLLQQLGNAAFFLTGNGGEGGSLPVGNVIGDPLAGAASGGRIRRGSLRQVNEFGSELVTMRGRDYMMFGADAYVTPANQVAGRMGKGGGGSFTYAPTIQVDSRSDRAAVLADTSALLEESFRQFEEQIRARGGI